VSVYLIPETIRQQIGIGVFMSLGATDLMADRVHSDRAPDFDTLVFNARILDDKHRKRIMCVRVTLDWSDTYSIKVTYPQRGTGDEVIHFEAEDVYCDQLAGMLLALDQVL
jgi:hypothetical protein